MLLYLIAAASKDSFDLSSSETTHFKILYALILSFDVRLWAGWAYSPFLAIRVVSVEFVLSSSSVSHWYKRDILSCFKIMNKMISFPGKNAAVFLWSLRLFKHEENKQSKQCYFIISFFAFSNCLLCSVSCLFNCS